MCGRLRRENAGEDELSERVKLSGEDLYRLGLRLTFNAAPGTDQPVIVEEADGANHIRLMHWGLRRPWSTPPMPVPSNARAESILQKPMFADLIARKRCLAVATGYYEWQKAGKRRVPHLIRPTEGVMLMAALYDAWRLENGEIASSYCLITTEPATEISHIHNRMPAILRPGEEALWLDRKRNDVEQVMTLIRPYPGESLHWHPVSSRINDPRADDPGLVDPVEENEPVEQLALLV